MRHVLPWPRPISDLNCRTNGTMDPVLFSELLWETARLIGGDLIHVQSKRGQGVLVSPEPRLRGKVDAVKLPDGKWAWAKKETGS